jgi:putative SOS response-associated peptidase YedK
MCARFTLTTELSAFGKFIEFVMRVAFFAPHYNIAPRQQAPVLLRENGQNVARLMRWGLIPSWAKDESIGDKLINARAETLMEKSSFRKPFAAQRCLIPADGYYEWQRGSRAVSAPLRRAKESSVEGRGLELEFDTSPDLRHDPHLVPRVRDHPLHSQGAPHPSAGHLLPIGCGEGKSDGRGTRSTPFRFTMKDGGPFCFAGLWEKWIRPPQAQEFLIDDDGDAPQPSRVIETFTIITTTPNEMAAAVHDRMPVILTPDHYGWWLDERRPGADLKILLRPFPAEAMACYRVSALVNNARNDSPECIKPA